MEYGKGVMTVLMRGILFIIFTPKALEHALAVNIAIKLS
jgi:hypothetical protein